MGMMRFIYPPDRITEQTAQQAYLSGYDKTPWPNQFALADGQLELTRSVADSGNLHIPWNVAGRGLLGLSTSTLMERPEPYYLPLELARGKVGQVRNQVSEWKALGLEIPPDVQERVADAVAFFAQAAVVEHGSRRSNELSQQAIEAALDAADLLADSFAEQVLATRKRGGQKLRSFLGADIGVAPLDEQAGQPYLKTFNAANVPIGWRDVETAQGHFRWDAVDAQIRWACASKLRVCAGPLLKLDPHVLPDWLTLYEGDFESLVLSASHFVETAVKRYRGRVDVWQCAGRVNTADVLSLSEEERIRLVARTIEIVRATDPDAPVMVAFDQPWGEYLNRREMEFPPLHFADSLIRANLGLSGLVLEINVAYYPGGSLPRDPLEFSRLLDYWSLLGVPLFVAITVPSDSSADRNSRRPASPPPEGWSPAAQDKWVARYVPLLLAKPSVQGVFWNQLSDAQPHDFPHGGLFDHQGRPKPALARLAVIRQAHLL